MDVAAIVRAAIREEQLPLQQLLAQHSLQFAQHQQQQAVFLRDIADRLEQHKLGCDARFDDISFQLATRAALTSSATTASSQQSSLVSGESPDEDSPPVDDDIWVQRPGWAALSNPAVPSLTVLEPLPHPAHHDPALSMMQQPAQPAGCYIIGGVHIGEAPASAAETVSHFQHHTAAPAQPLMMANGIAKSAYNPLQCMLCGKTYKRKRCVLHVKPLLCEL